MFGRWGRARIELVDHVGWPLTLRDTTGQPAIILRPLTLGDEPEWLALRRSNAAHVLPWEPTTPPTSSAISSVSFAEFVANLDAEARDGRMLPWVIEVDRKLVGQVHLFSVVRGSQLSAAAGYWVDRRHTRRGIAARSLAMAIDHALMDGGLHRVEVNIRVDNHASLGVARRLGLRDEGVRERFLHIDRAWRDHRSFAVTSEELGPKGLIGRLSHP